MVFNNSSPLVLKLIDLLALNLLALKLAKTIIFITTITRVKVHENQ